MVSDGDNCYEKIGQRDGESLGKSQILVKMFREEFSVAVMFDLRPRRFKGVSQVKKRGTTFWK